ncbi:site-specific integrase [Lysinibacillus sphaericus]|uniref:Site-specific integrase n=1 Tax=Lysinibacillus sphaericus TaxID=1421 RepID=A0A544UGC1_LYSSH|nr:site-specific integrase [Lysinibacillus sp. SDF0037]TQR31707.1 site-specific integrase [Lysinibacillus sp. SDF0037]
MKNVSKRYNAIKAYKLKNGAELFRFTVYLGVDPLTGKDKIVTRSKFKTVKHAELAIDKLKYEFTKGISPTNMLKTFKDVFVLWDENYKISGITMSTYSKTEGYFNNHILPFFGEKKLAKITVAMCDQFAIELSKKLKFFHHIINYASDVMETAIRYGNIHVNPFNSAKIPKEAPHTQNDNYIKVTDFKKLLQVLPDLAFKKQCILRLLMFTGMRKGELLALTWSDVNFDDAKLSIEAAYSYSKYNEGNNVGPTKTKVNSIIPLDPITLDILKTWKELQFEELKRLGLHRKPEKEQLLFTNTVNKHLKQNIPNEYLTEALNKANLERITLHGLRHTHVTHLCEAEANFSGIQHRVGHSPTKNPTTIRVYTHVTEYVKLETLQSLLDYYEKFDIK